MLMLILLFSGLIFFILLMLLISGESSKRQSISLIICFIISLISTILLLNPPIKEVATSFNLVKVNQGISGYLLTTDKDYVVSDGSKLYSIPKEKTSIISGLPILIKTENKFPNDFARFCYLQSESVKYTISLPGG